MRRLRRFAVVVMQEMMQAMPAEHRTHMREMMVRDSAAAARQPARRPAGQPAKRAPKPAPKPVDPHAGHGRPPATGPGSLGGHGR